jgi:hypothetical protein
MLTRKKIGGLFAGAALVLTLAACQEKDAAKVDLGQPKVTGDAVPTDFEQRVPEKAQIYSNFDGHANVVRLCIGELGFYTVSNAYVGLATPAVNRVPEWDAYCAAP